MAEIKIICKDCGQEFTIDEKEQKWYNDKGFELPKRCTNCRKKRKAERNR